MISEGMERKIRPRAVYLRHITETPGDSRTKQSFKDDCDINLIVKRHASTGLWDHLSARPPTFGDMTGAADLQSALELVDQAEAGFRELPAAVRQLCDNNPVNLLTGLADEESYELLVEAGLPGLTTRLAEPPEVPAAAPAAPEPEPETG